MKIMVINSGSSSIKYQIFDMRDRSVLASGLLEKIGEPDSRLAHQTLVQGNRFEKIEKKAAVADHRQGFDLINTVLKETGSLRNMTELAGIGHRVVHGGEAFTQPTLIDDTVIDTILVGGEGFGGDDKSADPGQLGVGILDGQCQGIQGREKFFQYR